MAPLPLEQISLRQRDRAFVVGGVDAGKSTLMDYLGAEFVYRYRNVGGRRLIVDSKPRYKAEYTVQGVSAARRYRKWAHGQPVRGSVVVDDPDDLRLAWETGARNVIVQCDDHRQLPRLVATVRAFLESSKASRPQLLQVDEVLDFYHGNGAPVGQDDAIARCARGGRERGTGVLIGSQRTKGLATTLLAEMNRCYVLRIDYVADAKRLQEMGMPPVQIPTERHRFWYWTKDAYRDVFGPYQLDIPKR